MLLNIKPAVTDIYTNKKVLDFTTTASINIGVWVTTNTNFLLMGTLVVVDSILVLSFNTNMTVVIDTVTNVTSDSESL